MATVQFERHPHNREHPFSIISNDIIRHPTLSLDTIALLIRMLSLPTGWRMTEQSLRKFGRDKPIGDTVMRRMMRELQEHGYLEKVAIRDAKGLVTEWRWYVREHPKPADQGTSDGVVSSAEKMPSQGGFSQNVGFPHCGQPTAIRSTEKEEILEKSMHREMPACSFFEKECPELAELVEAIRPLEESEHNTVSLAKDAKQRGVTPGELRDLVAEVLKKPRRNCGGLLRRMLQAGDVERLRAEKTARHEADVRRRIEESLQKNIEFARDATHRSPNRELGFIWVDDSTNTCYIGPTTAYGFDLAQPQKLFQEKINGFMQRGRFCAR